MFVVCIEYLEGSTRDTLNILEHFPSSLSLAAAASAAACTRARSETGGFCLPSYLKSKKIENGLDFTATQSIATPRSFFLFFFMGDNNIRLVINSECSLNLAQPDPSPTLIRIMIWGGLSLF